MMIAAAPAGSAPPAQADAWTIDYGETRCTAQRGFEDDGRALELAIRPALDAQSYEITISGPTGDFQIPEQVMGTADFGHGPVKAWVLKHRDPATSRQVHRFRVPASVLVPPAASGTVAFAARDYRVQIDGLNFAAALGALDTCLKDLRQYWDAPSAGASTSASARSDIKALLKPDNHIDGGMWGGIKGSAHYVLFIDPAGKLAGCEAVSSDASPILDHLGCNILREKGQFTPALDANGNPVRDVIVTPQVRWKFG